MAVTNAQIQSYVDQRVRPSCAEILLWVLKRQNDLANIGDVYANLAGSPTWTDSNGNSPVHVALPSDVLAWNTFCANLLTVITGTATDANATLAVVQALQGQWPIIKQLPLLPIP